MTQLLSKYTKKPGWTQRLIGCRWRFWPPRASSLSAGGPNRASTWAMLMPRLGMAALFSCCTRSTSRTSADATPARHSKAAADNEIRMRGMTDSPKGSKDECRCVLADYRSEEHTSELQSLMRISYAVFCLKKKKKKI